MNTDDLKKECDLCRERLGDKLVQMEGRLTTMEITLWGRDGRNGLRAAINDLRRKMDMLLRFFWIASALPPLTVALLAVLKFLGKL